MKSFTLHSNRVVNMSGESLRGLQSGQHKHDTRSHWDILCLPVQDRVKHMVLHFAKYVGRLASRDIGDRAPVELTLVDTFIIVLAISNALNLDLASRMPADSATAKDSASTDDETFLSDLFTSMALVTGRLAKACESLDHLEAFNSRQELERGAVDLCGICISAAARLDMDLVARTKLKWSELERKGGFGA